MSDSAYRDSNHFERQIADGDVDGVQNAEGSQRQVVRNREFSGCKHSGLEEEEAADGTKEGVNGCEGIGIRKMYKDSFVVQRESEIEAKVEDQPKGLGVEERRGWRRGGDGGWDVFLVSVKSRCGGM